MPWNSPAVCRKLFREFQIRTKTVKWKAPFKVVWRRTKRAYFFITHFCSSAAANFERRHPLNDLATYFCYGKTKGCCDLTRTICCFGKREGWACNILKFQICVFQNFIFWYRENFIFWECEIMGIVDFEVSTFLYLEILFFGYLGTWGF